LNCWPDRVALALQRLGEARVHAHERGDPLVDPRDERIGRAEIAGLAGAELRVRVVGEDARGFQVPIDPLHEPVAFVLAEETAHHEDLQARGGDLKDVRLPCERIANDLADFPQVHEKALF
jgi:hypothetical protein